jgi:hypothetical protein
MSKYHEYQTCFNDQDSLVEALVQKGFNPEVRETPRQLIGIGGKKRPETAEVILSQAQVGQASNEIGFKKQEDGAFTAIISQFDGRAGAFDGAWLKDLVGLATEARAMQTAKKLGLKQISRKELPNGKIRLTLTTRG